VPCCYVCVIIFIFDKYFYDKYNNNCLGMLRHLTFGFLALSVLASQAGRGGGTSSTFTTIFSVIDSPEGNSGNAVDDKESPASLPREEERLPQHQVMEEEIFEARLGFQIVSNLNIVTENL